MLYCICLAGFLGLTAEAGQPAGIEWSAMRPLTWDDFLGSVPPDADAERVAATSTSLSWSYRYELELSNDACHYRILAIESAAIFHPDESWVRPGHRTPAVLVHEQGHFDLTQRYKNRFDERTRELVGSARPCPGRSQRKAARFVERDLGELVGSIYEDVWREYRQEQDAYDNATRHGIDIESQASWTQRLASLRQASD